MKKITKPNHILRHERKLRGWTQRHLASLIGTSEDRISRWEAGFPIRQQFQEKLCELFRKDARELGFLEGMEESTSTGGQGEQFLHSTRDPERLQSPSLPTLVSPFIQKESVSEQDYLHRYDHFLHLMHSDIQKSATWFGLKHTHISTLLSQWMGHVSTSCSQLQLVLHQEIHHLSSGQALCSSQEEYQQARQQLLMTLAGAPLALLPQFGQARSSPFFLEEFLVQCAAGITACWYLAKGHDLLMVEQLLSLYVPLLSQIGSQNLSHRQAAAGLLVQAYLIRALMALHRQDLGTREHHSREALRYSHLISESNLQAAAFLFHGYSYYYMQQPEHALGLFQRAIETLKEMSPLLRSDLSLGMAAAYAQCGKEEQAKEALTSAHLDFPPSAEYDPGFLYADCSLSTLYLWEGRTYLDLGALTANSAYYQQASNILNQIEELAVMNSERNRTGMVLCQARAALGLGEFEQCSLHLETGIALVEQLGSVRRFHEASSVLQQLVHRWPHEKQSRQLSERLKQSSLARQLFPAQR